jgi:hypothetical protein
LCIAAGRTGKRGGEGRSGFRLAGVTSPLIRRKNGRQLDDEFPPRR